MSKRTKITLVTNCFIPVFLWKKTSKIQKFLFTKSLNTMMFRDSRDAGLDILYGINLANGAVYIAHSAILIHGTRKVIPKKINT